MYSGNADPQCVPMCARNNSVPSTAPTNVSAANMATPTPAPAAANQRLGPPVPKSIAPVSAWQRRDTRLACLQQAVVAPTNVFDTRRRDARCTRQQRKRRSEELLQAESERNHADTKPEAERNTMAAYVDKLPDPKAIGNLPSIPKITRPEVKRDGEAVPAKRKRENVCTELPPAADKKRASSPELVAVKGLRNDHKEHHMHRNRDKSASPEHVESGAEGAVTSEPLKESWFETGGNPAASGEAAVEAPSVAASESTLHCCALCGDIFQQFFNNDEQEWHIRNAIKHKDDYYHPLCFKDYKTPLTKAGEPKVKESSEDIASEETMEEESIETKDVDRTAEQSDDDSVDEDVEDPRELDPVDDEDNEADGCFKAEQLVELLDEDDPETGVEISAERAAQGHLAEAEIDVSEIKIKREPIDPGIEKPIGTAEEETIPSRIYHTHPTVESSIDGDL